MRTAAPAIRVNTFLPVHSTAHAWVEEAEGRRLLAGRCYQGIILHLFKYCRYSPAPLAFSSGNLSPHIEV